MLGGCPTMPFSPDSSPACALHADRLSSKNYPRDINYMPACPVSSQKVGVVLCRWALFLEPRIFESHSTMTAAWYAIRYVRNWQSVSPAQNWPSLPWRCLKSRLGGHNSWSHLWCGLLKRDPNGSTWSYWEITEILYNVLVFLWLHKNLALMILDAGSLILEKRIASPYHYWIKLIEYSISTSIQHPASLVSSAKAFLS